MNDVPTKVLLPYWLFEKGEGDADAISQLAKEYIKPRYKGYFIIIIEYPFAICKKVGYL